MQISNERGGGARSIDPSPAMYHPRQAPLTPTYALGQRGVGGGSSLLGHLVKECQELRALFPGIGGAVDDCCYRCRQRDEL